MFTHTALVKVYCDGALVEPGENCLFTGTPNWKYRPLDASERADWEVRFANSDLVENGLVGVLPPADKPARDSVNR